MEIVLRHEVEEKIIAANFTSAERRVEFFLRKSANEKGEVFRTQSEIARELGISRITVAKAYKKLQDLNYMKVVRSGKIVLNPDYVRASFGNRELFHANHMTWNELSDNEAAGARLSRSIKAKSRPEEADNTYSIEDGSEALPEAVGQ